MNLLLYNIFISLYGAILNLASLLNEKAKKWVLGRKDWENQLNFNLKPHEKRIWIHCASLGEFEQGRPLIEKIKLSCPEYKIVLTFFSPSGYEIRKNYEYADYVFYLPLDTKRNAQKLIKLINPIFVIFVKYEFWYHYITQLYINNIPAILISAAFRPNQPFFKWYGGFFRKILQAFHFIFVQDDSCLQLLVSIGLTKKVAISGDTRYDRVAEIAKNLKPIEKIDLFKNNQPIIICGSTWPEDEIILQNCFSSIPENWKWIIAPHEIDNTHIQKIQELFGKDAILYSELIKTAKDLDNRVLIIDNIGMLSRLYVYGDIAYIGGGFNEGGIHNILEATIFGLPVLFGSNYNKFIEANTLVNLGLAFPIYNEEECKTKINQLIEDKEYSNKIHENLLAFMHQKTGATSIIFEYLQKQGWLK